MSAPGNHNVSNYGFPNPPVSAGPSTNLQLDSPSEPPSTTRQQRPASSPLTGFTPITGRTSQSLRITSRLNQNLNINSSPTDINLPLHNPITLMSNSDNESIQNTINPPRSAPKAQENETSNDISTCPYGCCNTPSIPEYLFINGLVKGNHYDVIIKAFGKKYKLHKIFLERSLYFESLFSWSDGIKSKSKGLNIDNEVSDSDSDSGINSELESVSNFNDYRKVYELSFEHLDDSTISTQKKSFELAISRLYGAINLKEEFKIPYNMIEMGQYLAISDIVCSSTDYIIRNMNMSNIAENLSFALNSDFGSASQRIIENGKGILSSNGWEKGPESWDGIPTSIMAEIVGENYFFVPTEWDRCIFIIKLIERILENRAKTDDTSENDDILPLKKVLNEKIYYCHMPPHQLQQLESLQDINEEYYIAPQVLHTALWQSVQLETVVTRSRDVPNLDNVLISENAPSNTNQWFKVPSKDETLSGLPKELDLLVDQSLSTTLPNKTDMGASKITQDEPTFIDNNGDKKLYNWTKIPPFRFSISFANVSELATDKRVYGKTFWYAGSYWNLYLQKSFIASKNSYQVGVYLHRAHNGLSNSATKNGLINSDVFSNNVNYQSLPKIYQTNKTDFDAKSWVGLQSLVTNDSPIDKLNMELCDLSLSEEIASNSKAHNVHNNNSRNDSVIRYEDQRTSIKVYFVIFTPSRRSAPTITSFLSIPNQFSKSQSWGWKSNNMCVFNDDGTFAEGQDPNLKFMILLGNV